MSATAKHTTPSGASIEARLSDDGTVQISQDGVWAGVGRWVEGGSDGCGRIVECAARLGAPSGSETEDAYEALETLLEQAMCAACQHEEPCDIHDEEPLA